MANFRKSRLNERINKYVTEYVLQGNYGYGWDDLVSYDDYSEAREDYKTYRENEPKFSHRIVTRRVKNPEYKEVQESNYKTNIRKSRLKESTLNERAKVSGNTVYVAILELEYTHIAVGNSKEECIANMIAAFEDVVDDNYFVDSVEEWVSDIAGEDYSDYNNDVWTFLNEYYGINITPVNGHATVGM